MVRWPRNPSCLLLGFVWFGMAITRSAHALTPLLLFALPTAAAHRVLVPQPQEIRYGAGRVPVCSVGLKLAKDAAAEDQFAAGEFARIRSKHCGSSLKPSAFIEVKRTGSVAPLPVPGEAGGPSSREFYSLDIGATGGWLLARSTAGIFYGIQTLRQLVEGEGAEASWPEVDIRD